jgi:ABC-type transport system substrate-binding protein
VRVRQALNYCIDRSGLVALLNGTAEPSVGWLKPADAGFGAPANRYGFDPAKGKALLAAAGYTAAKPLSFKVMISTSGSGQMLPLPMNEYLQDNLKQSCGVNVDFDTVEWQVLLTAVRATPDSPTLHGAMALNVSSPSSDVGIMARYFSSANFSPTASISSNGRTTSSMRRWRRSLPRPTPPRSMRPTGPPTSVSSTIRRGSSSCKSLTSGARCGGAGHSGSRQRQADAALRA